MSARLHSGSQVFDDLLEGGFELDVISTFYGPSGAGKTTICLVAAVSAAQQGKKVIYMDTEGGFSVERLKQLTPDFKEVLDRIIFLRPTNFGEQRKAFERLKDLVKADDIGIVIVDTIAMLYRLELGQAEKVYDVNKDLGRQIGWLTEIARKKSIPVLIANQVYSNFDERDKVNLVGGDILKYGSKCLIELQITPDRKRRAVIKKHRSIAEDTEALYEIVKEGIVGPKKKGFGLF